MQGPPAFVVGGPINEDEFTKDKAKATAKAFLDGAFQAPHAGFTGKTALNGVELLEDEVELACVLLDKKLEAKVKKSEDKRESKSKSAKKGCCGFSLACCFPCCFGGKSSGCCGCCKDNTVAPAVSAGAAAGAYEMFQYVVVITNQRIIIREEDTTALHFAHAAHVSVATKDPGCCCGCFGGSTASANTHVRKSTTTAEKVVNERMYLVSDLKDVKFLMIEKRRLEEESKSESASVVGTGCLSCCGAPPVEEEARREDKRKESTYLELDVRLTFVKKVGDYQGPSWQWFEGIKASHTVEALRGTVLDPARAHALRRALMMHQERIKPSVPGAAAINVSPGDGTEKLAGLGLGAMLGGGGRGSSDGSSQGGKA